MRNFPTNQKSQVKPLSDEHQYRQRRGWLYIDNYYVFTRVRQIMESVSSQAVYHWKTINGCFLLKCRETMIAFVILSGHSKWESRYKDITSPSTTPPLTLLSLKILRKTFVSVTIVILIAASLCDAIPCMNGGQCSIQDGYFACTCTNGYYGDQCQCMYQK